MQLNRKSIINLDKKRHWVTPVSSSQGTAQISEGTSVPALTKSQLKAEDERLGTAGSSSLLSNPPGPQSVLWPLWCRAGSPDGTGVISASHCCRFPYAGVCTIPGICFPQALHRCNQTRDRLVDFQLVWELRSQGKSKKKRSPEKYICVCERGKHSLN